MNQEKKKIEIYSYLIRILALTRVYSLTDKEKDDVINDIEKVTMEALNYFENVNFNRPNYFFRDYYPSPQIRILLLLINEDKYLFKKDDKSNLEILNFLLHLEEEISESINKYLSSLSLDLKYEDLEFKGMKFRKVLEKSNDFPLNEYVIIFKSDKKLSSLDKDKLIYEDVNLNEEKLKNIKKEELTEFIILSNKDKISIK